MGRATLKVRESEVRIEAVRSSGAGGQNVNKVSSAVHLRFDIAASSLPGGVKARLLALQDRRITRDGVIVIKAWQHRSQDMNREDALARLERLVNSVAEPPKRRIPTRPTGSSKLRRIESKIRRGRLKALRGKVQLG
ncbi:MAG TPA: alternative ribosome rescue aminoacyl-tRNA hydrolase ArfB [Burkholderiales bacterium]|jgi:ribosome-associated protein|nr:alternative ribosome rescue aminoacyl-tRNA hydrolase ArfB [Burkholderiales bacterium]